MVLKGLNIDGVIKVDNARVYGLEESIKNKSNWHLSFSKLTFPHQLFRIMLLEQIYRSYKIINMYSVVPLLVKKSNRKILFFPYFSGVSGIL